MAEKKTTEPVPYKFQPVVRLAYEFVGGARVFEVDKNNVWQIRDAARSVTPREKQLLERARQAMEALVAEVAETNAEIEKQEAGLATEKGVGG